MRKLLAAFFLFIFAFNVGGYYLIFWGLQYHATLQITRQADAGTYASNDEVIFQVTHNLPYPIAHDEFTRINGAFEHNGEFYQIIKQKIVGDKLVLVCLRNHEQKKLTHALSDLTKVTQDLPDGSRQALRTLAKLFKDFQFSETPLLHAGNSWWLEIGATDLVLSSDLPCAEVAGPPPRLS